MLPSCIQNAFGCFLRSIIFEAAFVFLVGKLGSLEIAASRSWQQGLPTIRLRVVTRAIFSRKLSHYLCSLQAPFFNLLSDAAEQAIYSKFNQLSDI